MRNLEVAIERGEERKAGARWVLLLGLLFAFSPVLMDMFDHLASHPWARASLVFPWLAWFSSRREPKRIEGFAWGWVAVGAGLVVELVAVAGDIVRLGRFGLVLAAMGLCLGGGWTSGRLALLLIWAVPVPSFVYAALSPAIESTLATLAAGLASLTGLAVEGREHTLVTTVGRIDLGPEDGGLVLAYFSAGLGWFSRIDASYSWKARVRAAVLYSLLGFPIQLTFVCAVAIALGLGLDAELLRAALAVIPWLLIWGLAIRLVWKRKTTELGALNS